MSGMLTYGRNCDPNASIGGLGGIEKKTVDAMQRCMSNPRPTYLRVQVEFIE